MVLKIYHKKGFQNYIQVRVSEMKNSRKIKCKICETYRTRVVYTKY